MKKDKEEILSNLKQQILASFPSTKILNEYQKNGSSILEIFNSEVSEEEISEMTSKLATEILIEYGVDILVLVHDNPKVLDWYKVERN